MSMHLVEYSYMLPETGVIEIELDPDLDQIEKEEISLVHIKEIYDDIEDIEIESIKPL